MKRAAICSLLAVLLTSACASPGKPASRAGSPEVLRDRTGASLQPQSPPPTPATPPSEPPPVTAPAPETPKREATAPETSAATQAPQKMMSLRFEAVDLEVVLRVLAETAGVSFVLAQGVKVQVTMHIDRVPASEAMSIIEALLDANNLVAIKAGRVYKIVPAAAAGQQSAPIGVGKVLGVGEGYLTQIVPLQYLAADELVKVLQPLVAGGKVLAYRETNSVILSGPVSLIKRLLETIEILDLPSKQREAPQIYVYYVENAKAKDLATLLASLFGGKEAPARIGSVAAPPPGAPYITAPPPPTPPRPGLPALPPAGAPGAPGGPSLPEEEVKLFGEVKMVADERTNSLIIRATAQDYKVIEETIKKLDITPKQVVIEVLAAEITLTENFSFGLEWIFKAQGIPFQQFFGLGPIPSTLIKGVVPATRGFTLTFVDQDLFRAFLNTLSTFTKINTLATPHILTQDNKEARIQVGQEVPIVTGTQSTLTAVAQQGQNVFQTLQQRDVGRILTIKPHVNEKRQVALDIQLEVSDVASLQTGSIGSPTFSKRTVVTSLVVEDRQSLLIGGIISTQHTNGYTGIPLLSKIPILGWLFRTTDISDLRTELFIMLTPHVVGDPEEGRRLTEDFKQRLKWLEKEMKRPP